MATPYLQHELLDGDRASNPEIEVDRTAAAMTEVAQEQQLIVRNQGFRERDILGLDRANGPVELASHWWSQNKLYKYNNVSTQKRKQGCAIFGNQQQKQQSRN